MASISTLLKAKVACPIHQHTRSGGSSRQLYAARLIMMMEMLIAGLLRERQRK